MDTRIRQGGRCTLPKELREQLGWNTGDVIAFEVQEDGSIFMSRIQTKRQHLEELISKYSRTEIGRPLSFSVRPTPPSGPSPQAT